jgi:hypothetical protein
MYEDLKEALPNVSGDVASEDDVVAELWPVAQYVLELLSRCTTFVEDKGKQ